MASQDLNALKHYLRDYVETITEKSKGGLYVCPLCRSGTHSNQTGAFQINDKSFTGKRGKSYGAGEYWKCYACDKGGDIYALVREYEGLSASDAAKRVIEMYGSDATAIHLPTGRDGYLDWDSIIDDDWTPPPKEQKPEAAEDSGSTNETTRPALDRSERNEQKATEDEPEKSRRAENEPEPTPDANTQEKKSIGDEIRENVRRYKQAFEGSEGEAYLRARGFTDAGIKLAYFGYDAEARAVVIPYIGNGKESPYYIKRSIDPQSYVKHEKLKGVPVPLYNSEALYKGNTCFIVESPLCAASILQCGGYAVALSGTATGTLIEVLTKKPTVATLILCLDNDEAGKKATHVAAEALEKIGAFCVDGTQLLMTGGAEGEARKDPNEILQKDGEAALIERVKGVTAYAQSERGSHDVMMRVVEAKKSSLEAIDLFLHDIRTRMYEPVATGIKVIDKVLNGGFMRGQLVLLGAAPGVGKTAISQMIFENMAANGTPVVYLNLEMSRQQILARTLSRMAKAEKFDITPTEILKGYCWTPEQEKAVLHAADTYKQTAAPYMKYNPDEVGANLDEILAYMQSEGRRTKRDNLPTPFFCVDYLQILHGKTNEDDASLIKRAVDGFKHFAIEYNTVVYAIVAHNREANRSGDATMESGRDTSALEYSADLQLALAYTKCMERDGQPAPKQAKNLTPDERRYITLKITKARFGGQGASVDLYFDGESMTFYEPYQDRNMRQPILTRLY